MNSLLAFDTATERISIALCRQERVWQHEGDGGAKASAAFLPAVLALLAEADMRVADLDAIACGRGPGAFTGLRTACAVAQGLAFGGAKPVLPIDTLLALAEDARAGADTVRIWAVMDARMDEIYAAEYAHGSDGWEARVAPMLISVAALNRRWREEPPEVVAGNALPVFGARLESGAARRIESAMPRAVGMLTLARAQWTQRGGVDAALALPVYLRDKVAQTTAERETASAARAHR